MDDRRFDAMVRSLATGGSRRQVLKGVLGFGGAVAAGSIVLEADAARRPTPTPKPVKCPQGQHWDGSKCICDSGDTCGSDCCVGESTCCDNACCYGYCYGEELCCPAEQSFCEATGECCPPGTECCGESGCQESCCEPSCDGTVCGLDDGCGGTCGCTDGKTCAQGICLCPAGTMSCPDGACRACCELSNQSTECAITQGGVPSCWACSAANGPGSTERVCGPWSGGCTLPQGGGGTCNDSHFCVPN